MNVTTKIVVTHWAAIEAKYGTGASRILAALEGLVAADAARGIATTLVRLDRATDLAPFGALPMRDARDQEGAKRAVDAIDEAIRPHYYLILGGPDIVPMQELENTIGMVSRSAAVGDSDFNVPSDAPYACDAPYSKDPTDFQHPSRVVGRLPDLTWAKRPVYLVELLRLAAAARPLPRAEFEKGFALSAKCWERATRACVEALFGRGARVDLSPPRKDPWPSSVLAPRLHFINCHGGNMDAAFAGEDVPDEDGNRGDFSVALTARTLRGKVTPGTVVAAECCYGAQLFDSSRGRDPGDPRDIPDVEWPARGTPGIALEYLRQGASGYFGSSTVAYGASYSPPGDPAFGNEHADVICRVFLEKVLEGCSLGRAALEARLAYARSVKRASPVLWKTLAQFHLLGDPSVHPVAGGRPERHRAVSAAQAHRQELERREHHRERDRREARAMEAAREHFQEDELPPERMGEVLARAEALGVRNKAVRAFTLLSGSRKVAKGDPSLAARRQANQVLMVTEAFETERKRLRKRIPYSRFGLVIAHYRDGRIVEDAIERLDSR